MGAVSSMCSKDSIKESQCTRAGGYQRKRYRTNDYFLNFRVKKLMLQRSQIRKTERWSKLSDVSNPLRMLGIEYGVGDNTNV